MWSKFIDEIPLNLRLDHYFQQDGCPAHSTQIIKNFLCDKFGEKWFGRNSVIPWPARSPVPSEPKSNSTQYSIVFQLFFAQIPISIPTAISISGSQQVLRELQRAFNTYQSFIAHKVKIKVVIIKVY